MNEPQRPRVILNISGIRQDTVAYAQRIVDMAREFDVHAGISLTLMGAYRQYPSEERTLWRLRDDEAALAFVHDCQSRGHEMLLAGLGPIGVTTKPSDKAPRVLDKRSLEKAEFRRLGRHESNLRIAAAQRQLESLGLLTTVFAPVRWSASEPALAAAAKCGFNVVAEAYSVRGCVPSRKTLKHIELPEGTAPLRSEGEQWVVFPNRVLAIGDGFGGEKWWRRQVKSSAQRMAEQYRTIRLSVNAGKAHKAGVIDDVRKTIERLQSYGYVGGRYAEYAESLNLPERSDSVA